MIYNGIFRPKIAQNKNKTLNLQRKTIQTNVINYLKHLLSWLT